MSWSPQVHPLAIVIAGNSQTGRREENEDAWWAGEIPGWGGDPSAPRLLVAVADGAGGHAQGALASRTAVEELRRSAPAWLGCLADSHLARLVSESFLRANAALQQQGGQISQKTCTTLTAGVIKGNRIFAAHVGDSRAYLVRAGRISQLTEDDSWVASQVRQGRISQSQASQSEHRGVLTQAIGSRPIVHLHQYAHDLRDGDRLLFCTDGLYVSVKPGELAGVLEAHEDPTAACEELLALAMSRDGSDNATAVVLQVGTRVARGATRPVRVPGLVMVWWRLRGCLRWLVPLLIFAALVIAYWLWPRPEAPAGVVPAPRNVPGPVPSPPVATRSGSAGSTRSRPAAPARRLRQEPPPLKAEPEGPKARPRRMRVDFATGNRIPD